MAESLEQIRADLASKAPVRYRTNLRPEQVQWLLTELELVDHHAVWMHGCDLEDCYGWGDKIRAGAPSMSEGKRKYAWTRKQVAAALADIEKTAAGRLLDVQVNDELRHKIHATRNRLLERRP